MLKIDSYHEHIVNLQGITYTWDLEKQNISEVTKTCILKSVSMDVTLKHILVSSDLIDIILSKYSCVFCWSTAQKEILENTLSRTAEVSKHH